MTNYEKIKNMTVDELAILIGVYRFENAEYFKWFTDKVCGTCKTVEVLTNGRKEYWAECEFEGNCPIADDLPDKARLWLNAEVQE